MNLCTWTCPYCSAQFSCDEGSTEANAKQLQNAAGEHLESYADGYCAILKVANQMNVGKKADGSRTDSR